MKSRGRVGRSRTAGRSGHHSGSMPRRSTDEPQDSLRHLSTPTPQEIERGRKIRVLRRKAGLSQATLGAMTGTTRSHISKIESGKDNPGRELLGKIAMHFRVSLDWLEGSTATSSAIRVQSPEEAELLEAWRALPDEEKRLMQQLIVSRSRPPKP